MNKVSDFILWECVSDLDVCIKQFSVCLLVLQGSILSTKMMDWATKFRFLWPKFKSGGQHNWGWRLDILDNFPSERGKYWTWRIIERIFVFTCLPCIFGYQFFLPWPQDFWSWWPPKLKSHFEACIVIEESVQQDKQSSCNKTIQNVDRSALSSSDT